MCEKRFARLELLQEDSQNFWGGGVDRTLGIGNVDEEADIEAVQGEVKVVSMSKRIPGEGDHDEPGTASVDPMTTSTDIIRLVRKDVLASPA